MFPEDESDPLKKFEKPPEEEEAKSFADKAKNLVRLVAGGFFLVGILNLAGYWLKARHEQTGMDIGRCVWLSIPLVIGAVILVKTTALAQRIADWLEQ